MNEKKLEKLQDLVTSLENLWFYDEAEELQEYLLNPKCNAGYIIDKFQDTFDFITKDLDTDWTDCRWDEEWNQYEWDLKWIEKILDVENDYTKYKDIVKYDRCYMFYDNVLSRWMVRWEQWIWLSNIEKDGWFNWQVSQEYIEKRKGIKEHIRWMPRIQEFTLKEYNNMLKKWWIDIDWEQVIFSTKKMYDCPDMNELLSLIWEEMIYGECEWYREMFKDLIEKEEKEKSEEEKEIDREKEELRRIEQETKKEQEELKKAYALA